MRSRIWPAKVDPAAVRSDASARALDQLDIADRGEDGDDREADGDCARRERPTRRATLYNSTMYLMAALLGVALIANLLVRPVDPKHHLRDA